MADKDVRPTERAFEQGIEAVPIRALWTASTASLDLDVSDVVAADHVHDVLGDAHGVVGDSLE